MNDMNDDFELPPLPKETVFSSEVGDIDDLIFAEEEYCVSAR